MELIFWGITMMIATLAIIMIGVGIMFIREGEWIGGIVLLLVAAATMFCGVGGILMRTIGG